MSSEPPYVGSYFFNGLRHTFSTVSMRRQIESSEVPDERGAQLGAPPLERPRMFGSFVKHCAGRFPVVYVPGKLPGI